MPLWNNISDIGCALCKSSYEQLQLISLVPSTAFVCLAPGMVVICSTNTERWNFKKYFTGYQMDGWQNVFITMYMSIKDGPSRSIFCYGKILIIKTMWRNRFSKYKNCVHQRARDNFGVISHSRESSLTSTTYFASVITIHTLHILYNLKLETDN